MLGIEDENFSDKKSLIEFRPRDEKTINLLNETTVEERMFFSMEPGRCVYHTLKAIGHSHLKSTVPSKPVCVKRKSIFPYHNPLSFDHYLL